MLLNQILGNNFPHQSVLSLSNAIIGVSVLSMPYCFQQCGIILGTVLMIICGFLTSYSCKILVDAAKQTSTTNYESLAFKTMGRSTKLIVEISSIGLLFGSIIAYEMIIGDLGSVVVSQLLNISNSSLLRSLLIIVLTGMISYPLSLSDRFDNLTPISIQSIIFYLLFCSYTVAQSWLNEPDNSSSSNELVYWRWSGIFLTLPILSLSFSCQTMLFVVYSELSDSTSHSMSDVIDLSVLLVGLIYFTTGVFGYLSFYKKYSSIPGNFMQIIPKNFLQQVFLWGFLMNCTTGIPFMANPTRTSLVSLWNNRYDQSYFDEHRYLPSRKKYFVTALVVFIPTVIALSIPNLEFILALTGATSGQLICYILPAILTWNLLIDRQSRMKNSILLIVGIASLIICTVMTFVSEVKLSEETQTTTIELYRQRRVTRFADALLPINVFNNTTVWTKDSEV